MCCGLTIIYQKFIIQPRCTYSIGKNPGVPVIARIQPTRYSEFRCRKILGVGDNDTVIGLGEIQGVVFIAFHPLGRGVDPYALEIERNGGVVYVVGNNIERSRDRSEGGRIKQNIDGARQAYR